MLNSASDRASDVVREFGPFRLEAAEGRLLRNGEPVPLPPKVFDLLAALVRRSGRLVTKDELMQELWPGTFVDEANLTQTVFTLRRALGDGDQGIRYIETVPRRGYRFVAPVRVPIPLAPPQLALVPSPSAADAPEVTASSVDAVHLADRGAIVAAPASESAFAAPAPAGSRVSPRHLRGVGIAAALLLAAGAITAWWTLRPDALPFERMTVRQVTTSGDVGDAAMSPDGRFIAFVRSERDRRSLWLHQVATNQALPVADMAGSFEQLTFSADGEQLYFVRAGVSRELFRLATLGGAPRHVLSNIWSPVAVSPDGGQVAFVRWYPERGVRELVVAGVDGEDQRAVLTRHSPHVLTYQGPVWSPDGRRVAVIANDAFGAPRPELVEVNVATLESRTITRDLPWNAGKVVWLPDDSSLIVSAGHLWHVAYPGGRTRQLTDDTNDYGDLALARNGTEMMALQRAEHSALWVAEDGDFTRASRVLTEAGLNRGIAWLPDRRLLFERVRNGNTDLWATSLDGRRLDLLVQGGGTDNFPAAGPLDSLVYATTREGGSTIWWRTIDGRRTHRVSDAGAQYAPDISPDGRAVVYHRADPALSWALWRAPLDGGSPRRITERPATHAVFSPDGRWIACNYLVEGNGEWGIAILPAEGGARLRVLNVPGEPVRRLGWTPDGRFILFSATDDALWRVPVEGGEPSRLARFEGERIQVFRWSPDGRRLAYVRHTRRNDVVLMTSK